MNIEELVKEFQELREKMIKVCNDVKWIKSIGYFIIGSLTAIMIKLFTS